MSAEMTPRQWTGAFLLGLAAAIIVIGQVIVRVHHVDDSETRLFINYWWLWLTAFLVALVGTWMTREQT